jgi:hypothetical protein
VPDKVPKLRSGFIEVTASWVPYALYYMRRILAKTTNAPGVAGSTNYAVPRDVLARNRMYVSCFVDEDLPTIEHTGEDNLLMRLRLCQPRPCNGAGLRRRIAGAG